MLWRARQHGYVLDRGGIMKILIFGAGVIGTIYAWQLAEAGQDVTLLVRQERKQAFEEKGIAITCLDRRVKPAKHITTIYRPHVVEDFSPIDGYELVVVCVKRNQLGGVLPQLAAKAGDALILFLQNNWSGGAEIEQELAPSRYLLGFPSAGGGRDGQAIQCVLGTGTMLGEADGRRTPRLTTIAEVMRKAGFKPRLTHQIIPWLWTHYAEIAAVLGGLLKAGSFHAFATSSPILRETLLAARETMAVCRARGVNLLRLPNILLLYLPLWLLVPATKRAYRSESARLVYEGHTAHAADEMLIMYHEVLAEGERLGVQMPHFRGFKTDVERQRMKESEPMCEVR
jgi:ketopantoate reductase